MWRIKISRILQFSQKSVSGIFWVADYEKSWRVQKLCVDVYIYVNICVCRYVDTYNNDVERKPGVRQLSPAGCQLTSRYFQKYRRCAETVVQKFINYKYNYKFIIIKI
jgi:hypothetical protein